MINVGVNLEKLQIFRLLCELQSFSMVAKELNASQSVISRNIQDIEKSVNKKLILNNQKPISLTQFGANLYEIVNDLYDDSNHIQENIIFQNTSFANDQIRVFISISMILGCILSDRIKKLLNNFPEIGIDISFTNEMNIDLMHKKDIVITKAPYPHHFVDNKFVKSYQMVFCASRDYIKKRGYPKFASSLKYHDFVYVRDYYYDEFASSEILSNISNKYITDNELCAIQTISYGGGIGIVPNFIVNEFPDILTFELDEKLKPFHVYTSVSNMKSNSYIDLITDFLQNEL